MPNTSINISPSISPDIAAKLTGSASPITTLGTQLLSTINKPILGNQTVVGRQNLAQDELARKEQEARKKYNNIIKKADRDFKNKKITQSQYNLIRSEADITLKNDLSTYSVARRQTEQKKNSEIKDFQKGVKTEQNRIKTENTKLKASTTRTEIRAKLDLTKQVLTNPSTLLLIYPGLGLLITNAFLNFITQRKRLEKQVEDVNLYIETKVIDEPTVIIATNLKNNTIQAINNAIAKLQAIERILKTINTALKIANVALKVIGILLALLPAVPGAVLKVFDFLNKVISGLSAILTVCLRILANEIIKLKELIERLKQIILRLNNKTLNILTDDQLLRLIQTILPVGSFPQFNTLTAVPVSGSTGFVNIGGRIVPLSSTSAAGTLPPTSGAGTATGTTAGAGTSVTPIQSTGGTGIGIITTGTTNQGIGTISPIPLGTGSIPVTGIGTGAGVTTGVGVTGTGIGNDILGGVGVGIGLDNTDVTVNLGEDGQPIILNLNDFGLSGLNEIALEELEQLPLELIDDTNISPTLTGLEQIPSLENQTNLYKGFRFEIKEEQDPRFVVRGIIKRRYAVAINRQGVEVLKSEYSFTLDPQDLVDQLKLVIDQRNLKG